jgi:hypothetical protein
VTVPALRTERRILARNPLIDRLPVIALVGLRRRRGRGGIEQSPATLQLPIPIAIGKQAVVTNAHESIGQDVQQETADEFLGWPVLVLGKC